MDKSQGQQAYNGMSISHIEVEDDQYDFDSSQSRLAYYSTFQYRDSRTVQSSAERAYRRASYSYIVVGIVRYLWTVFDTARYILLSLKIESYFS
jgi:hypothetical protein